MQAQGLTVRSPHGELSAELLRPEHAIALLVLAHGAGAGFRHTSLVGISRALAVQRIATLRFNFPYMEANKRRVDAPGVAAAALSAAAEEGAERAPDLPLYVGGHSFGGRMASQAVAAKRISSAGLVCLSFPLHAPNRPAVERAAHLADIGVPMLFLSGTRDALADPELLAEVIAPLGALARLHWLDDADHGYRTRKRERRDPRPVFEEIAEEVADFVEWASPRAFT